MQLVLMRHGETDWNVEKRIQGIRDIPLNEKGKRQVQEVTKQILNDGRYHFSQIITSPLTRAKQSASICSHLLDVPVEQAADFQERCFGGLEGKTWEEIRRDCRIGDIEEIEDSRYGMEDINSVSKRIERGLHDLGRTFQGQSILLVTHGSIIKQIAKKFGRDVGIVGNATLLDLK